MQANGLDLQLQPRQSAAQHASGTGRFALAHMCLLLGQIEPHPQASLECEECSLAKIGEWSVANSRSAHYCQLRWQHQIQIAMRDVLDHPNPRPSSARVDVPVKTSMLPEALASCKFSRCFSTCCGLETMCAVQARAVVFGPLEIGQSLHRPGACNNLCHRGQLYPFLHHGHPAGGRP
jgi:hypothetical protein